MKPLNRADGTGRSAGKTGGLGALVVGLLMALLPLLRKWLDIPIDDAAMKTILESAVGLILGLLGWSAYGIRRAQEKPNGA